MATDNVEQIAADVRRGWKNPDLRIKPDPDFALCVAMLERAKLDVDDGQKTLDALYRAIDLVKKAVKHYHNQVTATRQSLKDTATAIEWTQHPEHQWVAIDTVARASGYNPERLAEVILSGMSENTIEFVQGHVGAFCPLCGKKIGDDG